jgi:DNA repair ATPase RecN
LIGGRVADVVARKLRALGSAFQSCASHLPQIAAHADTHFEIEAVDIGPTLPCGG